MLARLGMLSLVLATAACGGGAESAVDAVPLAADAGAADAAALDSAVVADGRTPGAADAAPPVDAAAGDFDAGSFGQGGTAPVRHGPLTPIAVRSVGGLDGVAVRDVAVDSGGGVWATTERFVMYLPPGGAPRRLAAADGLAQGDATVAFQGVGAGLPGQALVGTWGRYVDVVDVQPGGAIDLHHIAITEPVHEGKVTIGFRLVVDLGSAWEGTAWIGAEHGHAAAHGMASGYCWWRSGCFEEHRHPDPSGHPSGDVRGLAVCPNHDLWTGDAKWVARMPWGPIGTTPDFWASPPGGYPDPLIDAFPGVADHVMALACDDRGVLWIGSYGNGLAQLDTLTLGIRYHDAAGTLPQNSITALAVDLDGSVWVGTSWGGIGRYRPRAGTWLYYGEDAGLPSDAITALAIDPRASPRIVYIGHARGLSAYQGE